MSNALTDAIEAHRAGSAAKSWPVVAKNATRLAALRSALLAGHRGEASIPGALDDGFAAAEEMAAQDLSALVCADFESGWTAELEDITAVGGKKLGVTSPEADRLEFFFDASGGLYLGGLSATVDGARIAIPFKRAASGPGLIEIIANGLDADATPASEAGTPALHDAQQLQAALGGIAATAVVAAEQVTRLRRQPASPSPGAVPAAPPSQPKQGKQRQEKYCRQCGNARKPGDRFCAYCGAGLATGSDNHRESLAENGGSLACPACGGAINPGWKFCRGCGAKLS